MSGLSRVDLLRAVLFALAYFAGSELGYALSLGPSVGGTFWPPAGIALAFVLASPTRAWPLLIAAGVVANYGSDLLHGQILPASIAFAAANLSEPLVGALLIRRFVGDAVTFTRLQELVVLALVVVFVGAPLAAGIGAFAAELFTRNPPGFAAGWRTWWVGDAVGALVLTPPVFRILKGWRQVRRIERHTWLEAAAFTFSVLAMTHVVFSAPPTSIAAPFLVFPVLMWGSVRLGVTAVGGALCLVVALTTHDTVWGYGPFAGEHLSLGDRLVALQVYVGVMALSFHGLALLWEERARTAAALRLAHSGLEARYRRIVEQSPLAILALQPGGRVQDVNPAWQRLFVQPNDGALPAPAPWKDPGIEPFLNRAFAGDIVELPERELTLQGEAGAEPRRVHGFAYPVKDERGGVAEVVLIERDITDEVRARQQLVDANRTLREREEALSYALAQMAEAQTHREQLLEAERFARAEAERASLLKDEFLATLSHELRTPLNAIVGWAHILRRSSSDPAIVPAIDTIERNARAQAKLIEDLLDMSRIMAGKVGLTFERGSLGEIVSAAVDALLPAARARGVTLSMAAPSDEVWISCDAARVQQVVANLLDNGIKFTASGGSVEVRVSAGERHAQVVVRDNGQGIAAAFLPAVFDRFRQADGSTTRRHGGLGLGLSIARQIVEMHGGSIAAGSDGPGRGAVFTVTLPLAAGGAAQERAPDGDSEPAVLTGLRVLVVDDDADARELLQRLLAEQGCAVVCAASADDALREIARERPDVLLTDIGMPGADGYELLRRVREGHPRMPVVAITAFARLDDRDRAIAAGFDGHLPKPIEPAQLIRMLGQMWEGRRAPARAPAREQGH